MLINAVFVSPVDDLRLVAVGEDPDVPDFRGKQVSGPKYTSVFFHIRLFASFASLCKASPDSRYFATIIRV